VKLGETTYCINETGQHFDLIAKKKDGSAHYFEVKSTLSDFNHKHAFLISPSQWVSLSQPIGSESSRNLVFVFNVGNREKATAFRFEKKPLA
jgi:hypothetical protein